MQKKRIHELSEITDINEILDTSYLLIDDPSYTISKKIKYHTLIKGNSNTTETFINSGDGRILSKSTRWGIYFRNEYDTIRIKFNIQSTDGTINYSWKRYKADTMENDANLTFIEEGSASIDEFITFDNITLQDIIEITVPSSLDVYYGFTGYPLTNKMEIECHPCSIKKTGDIIDSIENFGSYFMDGTFEIVKFEADDYVGKAEFDELKAEFDELKAKVDNIDYPFSHVRWAVFGDSLTEKNNTATTSYYDYIKDDLKLNAIVNYGDSGTGYKKTESSDTAFYQRILTIDPNAFDILTIFGSGNDVAGNYYTLGTAIDTGTETLGGCINTTIDNFYSVAPFKKIALITPTPWASYNPINAENSMEKYSQLIVEIAKHRGIPCLDLYHCSGLRPWEEAYRVEYYNENGNQDTGIHPNSKGHKIIASIIREFIKTLI